MTDSPSSAPPLLLLFASDLHNNYRVWAQKCMGLSSQPRMKEAVQHLPSADIFFITGDWTEAGEEYEVLLFLRFLRRCVKAQKFKHIVCIAGNHDLSFDANRLYYNAELKQRFLSAVEKLGTVHYLENTAVHLLGLKIYGAPWINRSGCPGFLPLGGRPQIDQFLDQQWKSIPSDVDILMTHMPPADIPGFGPHSYHCKFLTERLAVLRPLVHCYGHVHPHRGVTLRRTADGKCSTYFINSAIQPRDFAHPILIQVQPRDRTDHTLFLDGLRQEWYSFKSSIQSASLPP